MRRPRPPFSRPFPVHDLPARGRLFEIEANAQERAALAVLYGIVEVERLAAQGWLRPEAAGRRVRVEGRLAARVVQTCVVTLEPVTAEIDAALERLYDLQADDEWGGADDAGEVHLTLADELPAEPLRGGMLDLGSAVAEQLSLELDPYPRAPGAVFAGFDDAVAAVAPRPRQDEAPPSPSAGRRRKPDGVP